MRHVAFLAIVLGAAPAVAGDLREPPELPPTIRLARPTGVVLGLHGDAEAEVGLRRLGVAVRVHRTDLEIELTIGLAGPARSAGNLDLAVPRGTAATALRLAAGGHHTDGVALAAAEARAAYNAELDRVRDPALLEWTGADDAGESLSLSLAPLGDDAPTATVTLRVPRASGAGQLVIDAPARVAIALAADAGAADALAITTRTTTRRGTGALRARGRGAITIGYGAATDALWVTDPPAPSVRVTGETALLAAPPEVRLPSSGCTITAPVAVSDPAPDHPGVRGVVRRHLPAIQHCYQQTIQRDWDREGTLAAEWLILADGSITGLAVSGADEELGACVEQELRTLRFSPGSQPVLVRYPFRFTLGADTRRARAAAALEPPPLPAGYAPR